MVKRIFMAFIMLFASTSLVLAEHLRVKEIHNLFNDDLGIWQRMFYQAMGSMGGFFGDPTWSPDGKRIVFSGVYKRGHDADLYVITLE
ncbi:MAG: hypothetical protein AB1348_00355 [Nitrospirota bacterium]